MKHGVSEPGSATETSCFIKKLDYGQSRKKADYVSDAHTIVWAL
jgi:hypothetical protein